MPAFWWVELSLFLLMSRALSGGMFWGVCELSMILGSLCVVGGFVFLFCLLSVVCCEASSPGRCWQLGGTGSWIQIEASMRALGD